MCPHSSRDYAGVPGHMGAGWLVCVLTTRQAQHRTYRHSYPYRGTTGRRLATPSPLLSQAVKIQTPLSGSDFWCKFQSLMLNKIIGPTAELP